MILSVSINRHVSYFSKTAQKKLKTTASSGSGGSVAVTSPATVLRDIPCTTMPQLLLHRYYDGNVPFCRTGFKDSQWNLLQTQLSADAEHKITKIQGAVKMLS
jgi:hypothetical protein